MVFLCRQNEQGGGGKVLKPSINAAAVVVRGRNLASPETSKTPPKGSKMPSNGSENGSLAVLRVDYRRPKTPSFRPESPDSFYRVNCVIDHSHSACKDFLLGWCEDA
jgi:hypothetical protein